MITFQSLKTVVDTIDHTYLLYKNGADVLRLVSSHVEMVALLCRKDIDNHIEVI